MISYISTACLCLVLIACQPSSEQLTVTAIAAQTQTQALAPTLTLTPSPTFTPSPTPTNTPIPTSTPKPTPIGGGSGKFIFSLKKQDFTISMFPDLKGVSNIFTMNLDGTEFSPVTNGIIENNSVLVQDISPNGHQALIQTLRERKNIGVIGDLYIVNLDGSGIIKLHDHSFFSATQTFLSSSYWLTNGTKIVYIAEEGGERYIFTVNSDGSNSQRLTKSGSYPNVLIPTSDDSSVYWEAGCPGKGTNYSCGYRKTSLSNLEEQKIWDLLSVESVARQANRVYFRGFMNDRAFIADLDGTNKLQVEYHINDHPILSPDGKSFLLINWQVNQAKLWLWSLPDLSVKEFDLNIEDVYSLEATWSPDSKLIFFNNMILNSKTMEVFELPIKFGPRFDFQALSLFWLLPQK